MRKKKQSDDLYKQTDKYIEKLKKKIRVEFNHLSVISFDELNVISTKQITKEAYERLLEFNNKEYLEIVEYARRYTEEMLTTEEKKKARKKKSALLLAGALSAYNATTGYLYKSEAERKRMRLAEEMLTAKYYQNKDNYRKSVNKSANLWFTQSAQYGQDVADFVSLESMKSAGIKKVMWNAEHDDRVCNECKERDGQVYDIDKVPEKPHYRCRCWLSVYRDQVASGRETTINNSQ